MSREVSASVRSAIQSLYPDHATEIEKRLSRATNQERAHQDILALALGDRKLLEKLCTRCEDEFSGERNIYVLESRPEEILTGVPRKDDAAAEMARRFEVLGFPGIERFASWGQHSKSWKKEWPNKTPDRTRLARPEVPGSAPQT